MDKRFQVFVSSTYQDLQEERKEVMQALLELDCIPAGMELFPASNEDQWSLIKRVIEDSDYYIVIIGGRYGSTADGVSYTEMEYRYAVEIGKPVLAFLHKSPENIVAKNTENSSEGKTKLEDFRKLTQNKLVKYWETASELGSVVSRSMVKLIKDCPAVGWVKADAIIDERSLLEINKLRRENEELKYQLSLNKITAPLGTEKLAQGDDEIEINLMFKGVDVNFNRKPLTEQVATTWNNLFAISSPYMAIECREIDIKKAITSYLSDLAYDDLMKIKKYTKFEGFDISSQEFQNIKVQFKALGLITKSLKNRSVKDTSNYWTLTEYGDFVMTQLIAIKKE